MHKDSQYKSLADIQAVLAEIGDAKKVILSVYFRHPYVLDEASGVRRAGAILANFGVSDAALMDVLTGKFKPQGKLPFALANNLDAVVANDPDAPGYPAKDTLWMFDLEEGRVILRRDAWRRRGDANNWLRSEVFDLGEPRSWEAEQAIRQAKDKDFSEVEVLLGILQAPFDDHPQHASRAGFPPDWAAGIEISCSS